MTPVLIEVRPPMAVPGARVSLIGRDLPRPADGPPGVTVGGLPARVTAASRERVEFVVPAAPAGGALPVRLAGQASSGESEGLPSGGVALEVGRQLITGIQQVDNPLFDSGGRLIATESGHRNQQATHPLFRVTAEGVRDPLKVDISNPTSLALGQDGAIYVSSRFEGHVYRIDGETTELFASELGVATGLAFGPDGALYVGDRSGSVMRVASDRSVETFATLPASVAAFHLAFGPTGHLFVAAPTLATRDEIYRISPDRLVDTLAVRFGRPQGLAFDPDGVLHVVEALAGSAGLYRVDVESSEDRAELVLAAPSLIGLAFDPSGGLVVASNDTLWHVGGRGTFPPKGGSWDEGRDPGS